MKKKISKQIRNRLKKVLSKMPPKKKILKRVAKKKAKVSSRPEVTTIAYESPIPIQANGAGNATGIEDKKSSALQFNNVLTASRMNTAMTCWRKHFWQCEIGLRKTFETSMALRVGSAWARAMEARWNGLSYDDALAAAIPVGSTLFSEYDAAIISGLLAGYYDVYGEREQFGKMHAEVQFRHDLGDGWTAEGKIDGLGSLTDGRSGIVESKTTSDSLQPDSSFWLRLNFNIQVQQYIVEARNLGWDIATTYYDVTKKPLLSPKESIEDLDFNGDKIVFDSQGNRVINEKGRFAGLPKQSADKEKGQYIKSHKETASEFCDRIYKDVLSRPDFYFCRKEIPVIENNLESFRRQRLLIRNTIEFYREQEQCLPTKRDPEAWPRNVSSDTCDFCSFKNFCLQNQTIDLEHPPEGFEIQSFNPELQK